MAHKLSRTPGSYPSLKDLCQGQEVHISPTENRQYHCSGVHQQPRRHGFKGPSVVDQGSVDVVPGKEHSHSSTAPPRDFELNSRPRITSNERPVGLEIGPANLQQDQQPVRATGSGPVCITADVLVPTLFQLAARSIGGSNRRLPTGLVNGERFRKPIMEPDRESSKEDSRSGGRDNTGSSCLESSIMVCPPTLAIGRLATPSTQSMVQHPARLPIPTTSRVEHLRESLCSQGLSGKATELILGSWRPKTNKSYDSLFGR